MSSGQEVGEIFGSGAGHATALLRSPTVIIASVGLWGMNVYLFRLFGIDYAHVLTLDLVKEKEAEIKNSIDNRSVVDEGDDDAGSLQGSIGGLEKRHSPAGGFVSKSHPVPVSTPSSNASVGTISTSGGKSATTLSLATTMTSPGAHRNPHDEVTAGKLIFFSIFLLLLLHSTTVIWIDFLGGSTIGAIFAFYSAVFVGIVIPLSSTAWIRKAVVTIFHRAFELVNPRCSCLQSGVPRAIPFIDVFFADAMCSLSKVFFDWGMLWHLAWHYPDAVPMDFEYILIPSLVASLPYLIRARQCLVMFTIGFMKSDPKRYQHMLNAIKYSTSLWPLCVSAYQKTVTSDAEKATLENLLIILLAINSTYSLAWDIVMDWGMMQNPIAVVPDSCAPNATSGGPSKNLSCAQAVLRPRLRFGASTSIFILVIDIILRYSWLLRFWEKNIFPNSDVYILSTQFLEAVRRALWNLLRVEWENIKQTRGRDATGEADEEAVFENDPFLAPSAVAMSPLGRSKQTDDKHES